MPIRFALMEDVLDEANPKRLPACLRVVYARTGPVRASTGSDLTVLQTGDCRLFAAPLALAGPGECWSFEVSPATGPVDGSREELARLIFATTLDRDADQPFLLRADRVDFPPGAVTPRHGHKGPGIRRLIEGRLLAEIGDDVFRLDAGDAWFEAGPDPVVGRTLAPHSAFVRVMVL